MATIRNLDVAVRANTKKFDKGMKRSRSALAKFTKAAKVAAVGAGIMGAAVLTLATVALVKLIKNSAAAIDSMAKLSDRLGIATEDLAGLQHGAEITGAGTEKLNKSLEFLAKALGEAKTGIGEGRQALDSLGLSVENLLGIGPANQMEILADAFGELATQEEKAFAASKLFGRSGVALVNLLDTGSAGLKQFRIEAEKSGLAISRIDAAQVEAMNDALTNLRETAKGAGFALTTQLSPFIEAATEALTEFAQQGEGLGAKVADGFEAVAEEVIFLTARMERLALMMKIVTNPQGQGAARLGMLVAGASPFPDFDELDRKIALRAQKTSMFFAKIRLKSKKAAEAAAKKGAPAGPAPDLDPRHGLPGIFSGSADPTMAGADRAFGALTEGVKNKLFGLAQAVQPVYENLAARVGDAWQEIVVAQEAILAKALRAQQNAAAFAGAAAGTIKTTLGDAVHDGLANGFDNLDDILQGFQQRFTQIIIDSFIEAAVGRQIEDAMSGLFGSLFGVGGGPDGTSGLDFSGVAT